MLKNYLKIGFRNLWKNKTSSFISILGLSVGLSVFIIGLLYLNHEWNYDKGFSDYKNIYRVETSNADGSRFLKTPQAISDVIKEKIPEIEGLTKFKETPLIQPLLKVNDNTVYIDHLYFADSSFFKIFNFPFIYGNRHNAFSKPDAIILSKQTAYKLFKDIDPTGKFVMIGEEGNFVPFVVTGVFDNDRFPTHLTVDAVRLDQAGATDLWNYWHYLYFKLNPYADVPALKKKLSELYTETFLHHFNENETKNKGSASSLKKTIFLQPLTNIYLHSHTKEEISKNGNETAIWLIACLAAFMLLVSAINFTNLNIAEAPVRAKEIAIRRFIGSSGIRILQQLYLEVLLKCFIAFIIALLIVAFALPAFSSALSVHLYLFENTGLKIWWEIFALLILTVIAAGTYPVLYIFYFKPVKVLKGNFIHSPKGNTVRNGLLIMQFMITSFFIAGVLMISDQVQFLRNKDLGFNPQQVVVLRTAQYQTQLQYPFINDQFSKIPGVKNISYASAIGQPKEQTTMRITVNGEEYSPQYVCVDTGYLNLMGARIISGRNFSGMLGDTLNTIIINRELSDQIGIKRTGNSDDIKVFGKAARIIGIVDNLNFYGFENKIGPMAFVIKARTFTPFILVKLNTPNIGAAIQSIQDKWKNIEPGYPLRYQFLDQSFNDLYNNYERLNKIFNYFTVCALFIALIGLFALTALITVQRSKEIAIRKVLGASVTDILKLVNRNFVKLAIIANILVLPITYFLSQQWLNNFAYRIEIPAAPFIIATSLSLILTIFTVCSQVFKVASAPAVETLKQE